MEGFLAPNRGVNTGEEEDERDVIATKSALQESGDYSPPGGHMSGWRDSETEQGLKTVQVRNNLWPDGRMRVDGPTHRIINAEKNERQTGSVPKSLGLIGSVGRHTSNNTVDVQKWRSNLGRLGHLDKAETDRPGDRFDNPLEWTTSRFQTDFNREPDGLVTPGGETETIMARVAAPLKVKVSSGGVPPGAAQSFNQSGLPTKGKGKANPKPTLNPLSKKPLPERLFDSVSGAVNELGELAGRGVGAYYDAGLWAYTKAGEVAGLDDATEYLDHFRRGTGMDRQIDWASAKNRNPVREGIERTHGYFERSFKDPQGNTARYHQMMTQMPDGTQLRLPPDRWTAEFGWKDHAGNLDLNEQLATATSKVESVAPDGFHVIRKGDTFEVFGSVDHIWKDDFDFGELTWGKALDPTEYFSNVARIARDYGSAKEYTTHMVGGRERFRGTYRLDNGQLQPVSEAWEEIGPETALR